MKIAIITDSTAYLTKEEQAKNNVYVLPLSINYEGKVYAEGEDLTPSEFYQLVKDGKTLAKTSQPAVGETMVLLETIAKEYDAAIAIHLSSQISGTFQTVASLQNEFADFKLYAVDSTRACGAQVQLVREAVRLAKEGQTPETIVAALQSMITEQRAYFLVDDLMHLQKGGRLSAGSAIIGSMLNIKPILTIDGVITPLEKIRTFKKGLARISELFSQYMATQDKAVVAFIHHANRLELAQNWQSDLQAQFPNVQFEIVEFGPVIGTHLGEGAVGLIFGPKASE